MSDTKQLKLWITQAKNGDSDAFANVYQTIYQDLYHFALYTLRNQQEAEDAVSETFVAAYESIANLRNINAFRGWIFRIQINQCHKIAKNRSLYIDGLDDNQYFDPDFAQTAALEEALSKLDAKERYIINLTVFAGYTSKEIGKELNLKPASIDRKSVV